MRSGPKTSRRVRGVLYALAGLAIALLAAASISWTLPVTVALVDEQGRPAADAYVRYHYRGYLLNFVHPVSYVARGSVITRADAGGRVRIPFRLHVRPPFPFSLPPEAFIDHVFVPRLHNAFGPISRLTQGHPGVFSIDWGAGLVTASDVSGDPERWERSLRTLYDCIRGTVEGREAARGDASTDGSARELVAHLRREYDALLAAHGGRPRTRPRSPAWHTDAERQAWTVQVDAQLAREPLWGPYLERMWRGELQELSRLEAGLRTSPPR